jgi:hypothetical protein
MNEPFPMLPPPELVGQWQDESPEMQIADHVQYLIARAAQWGADRELEACCKTLDMVNGSEYWSQVLRSGRRLKPPSLKEQALAALEVIPKLVGFENERDAIRHALEALPND